MHSFKKHRLLTGARAILLMASTAAPLSAATVNWGTSFESGLATSTGAAMDSSFTFEIGFFANSFIPTMENVSEWEENWRTFDSATYSGNDGWVTGTAEMNAEDGTSNGMGADVGVNFSEMEAYVWVYNVTSTGFQAEWFLGRHESWVFPSTLEDDCCDMRVEEWSLDDLGTGDTPVIGAHGEITGGGVTSQPGVYTIQTYAIPEPGSLWLMTLSLGACLRRRRVKSHN